MRKPILLSRTKKPTIQIGILRSIVLNGQQSKTSIKNTLNANYGDISDAFKALSSTGRIKLAYNRDPIRNKGAGRPERFYKISEAGLRFLLDSDFSVEIFWKAIILLSLCSRELIGEEEFNEYYQQFEFKRLGHSAVYGYLIQRKFFDDIINQWDTKFGSALTDEGKPSVSQSVIEFIAMKGKASLNELDTQFHLGDHLLRVISDLSVVTEVHGQLSSQSTDIRGNKAKDGRQEYQDFILHTLIVATKSGPGTTYELSLFGVLLVMLIVHRFHRSKLETNPIMSSGKNNNGTPSLYYHEVCIEDYFDIIARNYMHKLPLIFERWDLLKQGLGSLLLEAFNFLFYASGYYNSFNQSILHGGNKEYYEDLKSLSDDTGLKLYPVFQHGLRVKEMFGNYLDDSRFRGTYLLLSKKLDQIYITLKHSDISSFIENLKRKGSLPLLLGSNYQISMTDISVIEAIFRDELTFLFFLNLNVNKWHDKIFDKNNYQDIKSIHSGPGFPRYLETMKEISFLGPPRHRLALILNRDNEIKQWFTEWIKSITIYRKETVQKMSNNMKEIYTLDTGFLEKKEGRRKRVTQSDPQYDTEYNISMICSDIE